MGRSSRSSTSDEGNFPGFPGGGDYHDQSFSLGDVSILMLLMMMMKVTVPKLHHHFSLHEGLSLLQAADKVTDHRSPKAQLSETIVLSSEQPIQLHTF